ncbi:MAG: helix-turn-helix domain-containing protein [Clostridia bacterium]|nr:helix-turn-helix domain-containing protein [Clostridia bacterium]
MSLNIADNLKLLRYKSGYTLENLAEIISVSRQTVAKWEAGESYPDLLNCVKLTSLYRVSLDELVNKPLRDLETIGYSVDGGRICGVLDMSGEGTITLPKPVMDMFDMKPGEKVLLLADQRQGIAIIKCSRF